ncbi:hypothetical protein [Sphingomonas mollis]|nr:hypothetical protein [Sphingomonas sp. BT553]
MNSPLINIIEMAKRSISDLFPKAQQTMSYIQDANGRNCQKSFRLARPDAEALLPRRGWWTTAVFLCVAMQIGTTIVLPNQIWSMPAGMAGLAALCAFVTAAATPRERGSVGRWRWRLVTLGFTIWAISWATAAVTRSMIDHRDEFLHFFHIPRQIVFLIVLLPTVEEDRGWLLRGLDLGQTLLLAMAISLLAWPSGAASSTINGYLNSGVLFFGLVAITSLLTQRGHVRRLLTALAILFFLYAATSFGSTWIFQRYALARNSPWWGYGDAAYIFYALFLVWAGQPPSASPDQTRRRTSRHLPPLLLTAVLLMMAIGVGQRSTLGGAIVPRSADAYGHDVICADRHQRETITTSEAELLAPAIPSHPPESGQSASRLVPAPAESLVARRLSEPSEAIPRWDHCLGQNWRARFRCCWQARQC